MKRRIITSLALIAVVSVGVVGYQHFLFRRLSAELETQTQIIAESYASLVSENLIPLSQEFTLNEAQKKSVSHVQQMLDAIKEDDPVQEKLEEISSLQMSIVSFLTTVKTDQLFISDPRLVHLQKEMGDKGDIRGVLRDYNTTALRWNNAVQSELGSLTASLRSGNSDLLPYLRFDGGQEFVTIIEI